MKPSLPKGTRDFSPLEMSRRNYIFDTIRAVFRAYGYRQIETPAMENLSTLTGKYGDEGDKLIFKILNSGDFKKDVDFNLEANKLTLLISEKALRYDLTVPFARYVVMNRNDITFPFKRYQVQPVWRADRPQKGRYREFYQFDADVVGSNSLIYEAEFFQIFAKVFEKLNVPVTIKYNNRKVLNGIVESIGEEKRFGEIVTIIDKIDKIGLNGVVGELEKIGLNGDQTSYIEQIFSLSQAHKNTPNSRDTAQNFNINIDNVLLAELKNKLINTHVGIDGINELQTILTYLQAANTNTSNIEFDPSLARGLSYYTGTIYEVKANGVQIGSICGGGRYNTLTGLFGLPNVSGVGISFGVDRIYDVLNELNLFPETAADAPRVLITNFGVAEEKYSFNLATQLRAAGINADMYPTQAKLGKQFEYADKLKIPFVAVIGSEEMQSGKVNLKDMVSGEQKKYSVDEIIALLRS